MPKYATLLDHGKSTISTSLSEGNLRAIGTTTSDTGAFSVSSLGFNSGKFYFETTLVATEGDRLLMGVVREAALPPNFNNIGNDAQSWAVIMQSNVSNGTVYHNGDGSTYGKVDGDFYVGDTAMCCIDADAGKIWFGRNGYWKDGADPSTGNGASFTSIASGPYYFAVNATNTTTGVLRANFGQDGFRFTPPTGFKSLNTENLPTPTNFDANLGEYPSNYFDVKLYSGTGSSQSITGLNFQPDFVWIKERGSNSSHYLVDTVRGSGTGDSFNPIDISSTAASTYENLSSHLTSMNSDGFSLGSNSDTTFYVNRSSQNYAAYCWKAGGAPTVDNSAGAGNVPTSGSVMIDGSASTSTLAGSNPAIRLTANTKSGFSIVKYAGSASTTTVAHGLSSAPQLIMVKNLNGGFNTPLYHHELGNASYLLWNTTNTYSTGQSDWGSTNPSNTVFTLGGNEGRDSQAGANFIAYCWHEVPGFSKIGAWQNSNTTNGAFIHCGFKPRWIFLKNYDNSENWYIFDTRRNTFNRAPTSMAVFTTGTSQELTPSTATINVFSQGFQIETTNTAAGEISFGTRNYVFIALAEVPEKFSTAL